MGAEEIVSADVSRSSPFATPQDLKRSWTSVTYGNGTYIAVADTGYGNRVMSSTNGIDWVNQACPDSRWRSVAYGEETWVAVGAGTDPEDSDRSMISVDNGVSWSLRQTSTGSDSQIFASVTYSPADNIWVAVASGGVGNWLMTSPTGDVWTVISPPVRVRWQSVAYGNGIFVAVAWTSPTGTGNLVMTSNNGLSWTQRTAAADNEWRGVCFGNNLFVAVASSGSGNRVMTSSSGTTWTIRTSAADYFWSSVTFGNGLYVAVATSGTGDRVMVSSDGITWSTQQSAADNDWRSVCFGDNLFVAVASSGDGNRVMTSVDGLTWVIRQNAPDY